MKTEKTDLIDFKCNICGSHNRLDYSGFDRERRSCERCCSSVRTRSIVHLLSMELFGESMKLYDSPMLKSIRGAGLSDWQGYAKTLSEKFAYTNTYYHKEPKLDICNPCGFLPVDFLISSEVFEHVAPPVRRVFSSAYAILKDNGFLILTVPFLNNEEHTIEHFPELFEYQLAEQMPGKYELVNTTRDGRKQIFQNLRFHGGAGETLEMRVFSRNDLLDHLRSAGFNRVAVHCEEHPEFGIIWQNLNSTPIVAYKR